MLGLQDRLHPRNHVPFELGENSTSKIVLGKKPILDNIFIDILDNPDDGVTLNNCEIVTIKAKKDTSLTNTRAKVVTITKGTLTVKINNSMVNEYDKLEARRSILLRNVNAKEVISYEGNLRAYSCSLGKVSVTNSVRVIGSIINSLHLKINSLNVTTLELTSSVINGNVIIEMEKSKSSTSTSTSKIGNITFGQSSSAKGNSRIVMGGDEYSIDKFGNCQPVDQKPFTFEFLEKKVHKMLGQNGSCGSLPVLGGVVSVTKGEVKILKKPPLLISEAETEEKAPVVPSVLVEIYGGKIEGKVIFKNCEGKIGLKDGAKVCEHDIEMV